MRMPGLLALGLITSYVLLPTKPSESKLYFDAELKFNPPTSVRLHYAQFARLSGTEIQFATYTQVQGAIQSIFDEVVANNGSGVIEFDVEFQTYDPQTNIIFDTPPDPTNPFAGGGGAPGGFDQPPADAGQGQSMPAPRLMSLPAPTMGIQPKAAPGVEAGFPDLLQAQEMAHQVWRNSKQRTFASFGNGYRPSNYQMGPMAMGSTPWSPMQRGGGGEGGEGGGGGVPGGPTAGAQNEDEFVVSPILETQLNYSIAQNGRLLNFSGLDIIGDIINPRRNITVRQFWQTSHFLTLPDGPIHVGESWKGPWFWDVPYVGQTVEIPLTFTLEGIETMERFRVAVISFTGLRQFEMSTLDENLERRLESDIMGDIVVQGNVLFDIDRGVVVALAPDLNAKQPSIRQGGFPVPSQAGWGLAATISLDRIDTTTPLGNVLDTTPTEVHKLQEMGWGTQMVLE